MEYLKTSEWFCFSLKYKSFDKLSKQKLALSQIFLNFLRIFASLRFSFFEYAKILPHPREFDHHFLPRGRKLDKIFAMVTGIRSLKKHFPRAARGGGGGEGFTQLSELTETLTELYLCRQ